ncbi:hypothetical protein GQ55_6G080500 [Panicum hallii var. hallii]|uniref:Uncharacterized protein n=1 Tax=Panicum hallii var. hallii TaxID=1504633 RepID=A0A2T7D583_9POAL|nr:hypothetical protein GQ55_6G080500 [Panicum hallii var. hallii]
MAIELIQTMPKSLLPAPPDPPRCQRRGDLPISLAMATPAGLSSSLAALPHSPSCRLECRDLPISLALAPPTSPSSSPLELPHPSPW